MFDLSCFCGGRFQELERELELQMGLKQEMEVAMKLLEKDTHEKQDTLAALRLQLDQVKTLNLQMFHKTQVHAGVCPFSFLPHTRRHLTLAQMIRFLRSRNGKRKKSRRKLCSLSRG